MEKLHRFGRLFFAISIAFFGAQYLLYGHFEGGLPLVPPWTPGAPVLAYVLGVALTLSALSIATLWKARYSAISLGTLLLLSFLFLHCLHASSILHNGTDRTRAFECLTLAAIAFTLAGILPDGRNSSASGIATNWPLFLGRFLFAVSMIVFGAQHFMYAAFIATLIFGFGQAIYDANSSIHISQYLLSMTPYLLTLIVLAAVVRRSSPPAADGIPYVPGAE